MKLRWSKSSRLLQRVAFLVNINKTLNLKTLVKSQVDIDKFENHINIKKIHEAFPEIILRRFYFDHKAEDTL